MSKVSMMLVTVAFVMAFGLTSCLSETGDLVAELSATGGTAGSAGEAGSGGAGGGETGGTGGTETGGTGATGGTETGGTGATGGTGGTGGEAGTGGTGGASPECEPEGAMRDCKCPDGTSGTQECVDGEYEQCYCDYYPDKDGDGYGDADADPVPAPDKPSGHVGDNTDCDDNNKYIHPGATEVCTDGVDNNCNGLVDCADPSCASHQACQDYVYTFYRDADQDGYTTDETMKSSNPNPPTGWRAQKSSALDCDDNNPNVHPGATEVCTDNIDNNCNGLVDCADPSCASHQACQLPPVGNVKVDFQVDCKGKTWAALAPQPEGSWAGRNYGPLTGCVNTEPRVTTCTFQMPEQDFPTFVGQGLVAPNRYAGDASGNAPAPCVTPEDVDAMQAHAITLMCTVRLWKDDVPVQQRWESNGVIKPSGTQSCEASGAFPYYNSRPVQ